MSAARDTSPSSRPPSFAPAVRRYGLSAAVAVVLFWLAYRGGAYSVGTRTAVAIAAWWAVILASVLRLWPRASAPRTAIVAGALLAGFAAWTAASIGWSASAENAFAEFDRVTLYLGIFAVVVLAGTRRSAARWLDGVALALVAVAALALVSRFFPGTFATRGLPVFIPSAKPRLSFPVDYWNGLGILTGLGFPLLLGIATRAGTWRRGAALAGFPLLGATVYLTSSRGGVATALAGVLVFLALTAELWLALAALAVGGAAAALAVAVVVRRPELTSGETGSIAASQGHSAALLVGLLAAACGVAWALGSRHVRARLRVPARLGRVAGGLAAVLLVVAIAVSHPVRRFDAFKQVPTAAASANGDFTRAHLLSGNGSGRWQFWSVAMDEFRSAPLQGRGAGSYQAWWAEHAPFQYFVKDAHSLYLETLGELGLVGFGLLAGALGTGLVAGVRRARATAGEERTTLAALTGSFAGYLVGAGLDWMWELTIVSVIGIGYLALLCGPATATDRPRAASGPRSDRRPTPFAVGVGGLLVAWLLVCAQAIPFLSESKIRASQRRAGHGEIAAAASSALAARSIEPWAASPYRQLALVSEQAGDLRAARDWIGRAIDRDRNDWQLWLIAARIQTKAGAIADARSSFARAKALNPRSPLFSSP